MTDLQYRNNIMNKGSPLASLTFGQRETLKDISEDSNRQLKHGN